MLSTQLLGSLFPEAKVTDRALVKIAMDLEALAPTLPLEMLGPIYELLPAGLDKVAEYVDDQARLGTINFSARDTVLLTLCQGNHVKMAHMEAELSKGHLSLEEKRAAARTPEDSLSEFLNS